MSGGGGSSKPKADTPAAVPMQTVQPGMPGQISTLAGQLASGFGQQPADMLAYLNQFYQPMSLPNYAPVTPTTPTTPKPSTPKPGFPAGLPTQHDGTGGNGAMRDRTWGR